MRDIVLDELQFSCAVVLSREEVVPRFRVVTPDGEWTLFVPLPDDLDERVQRLRLVHGFMAWKSATAFVLSTELRELDCVLSADLALTSVMVAAKFRGSDKEEESERGPLAARDAALWSGGNYCNRSVSRICSKVVGDANVESLPSAKYWRLTMSVRAAFSGR